MKMDEAQRAAQRERYHRNKEAVLAQKKIYYLKNKQERIAYALEWNKKNGKKKLSYYNKWVKTHPEEAKVANRNRNARRRGAVGKHTAEEIRELAARQKHKCANPACRVSIRDSFHEDHIIAIVNGGTNFIRNIQLLCPPCNRRKAAKDPIVWARENGALL